MNALASRAFALTLFLIAGAVIRSLAASGEQELAPYFGPKAGHTYIFAIDGDPRGEKTQVAVASVSVDDQLVTCSTEKVQDFLKEPRQFATKPILSRIVIGRDEIATIRGNAKTILLRRPLKVGAETWVNRQTVRLPGGVHKTNISHCRIASLGKQAILGVTRDTVTVGCTIHAATYDLDTETTYARGVAPVEEDTRLLDIERKPSGSVRRRLVSIRDGVGNCMALASEALNAP